MKKTKKEMIVRECQTLKSKVGTQCKNCGGIMGENIDGKPICQCEVWPGNTPNVKISHLEILPLEEK